MKATSLVIAIVLTKLFLLFMLLIGAAFYAGLAALLALWTRVELSYWVSYVKGVPTTVEFWKAWVASLLIPLALMADVVSFISRLFM